MTSDLYEGRTLLGLWPGTCERDLRRALQPMTTMASHMGSASA